MLFIGRQFGYDRALEIVQDEQYLEDVDFDEIRRYDILKKIGEFNLNFNIPESRQKIQWQQGRFMGSWKTKRVAKICKKKIHDGFFLILFTVLRCIWAGWINLKILLGYDINYLSI